jgi:hypothetical protein
VITQGLDYQAELEAGFSNSIVEEVLLKGEPLCLYDASADDRWSAAASVQALGLRTVIALPYGTARKLMGVVYVDRQSLDPTLEATDLRMLDLLARTGAERVLALRNESELLGELAFERESANAALGLARAKNETERHNAVLAASLRLTGAGRAFWLSRPQPDAPWQALAAIDPEGRTLAYDPRQLSRSVLARTAAERTPICLVESEAQEGWTPGQSVLALGLRMVWCVPAGNDLLYIDTQHLTTLDPHRLAAKLAQMLQRLLPLD